MDRTAVRALACSALMRMLGRPDPKLRGGCSAEPFAIGSKTGMQSSMSADAEPRSPTVEALIEGNHLRSEEHTSELQSLMRISYAVFCLKKKTKTIHTDPRLEHEQLY